MRSIILLPNVYKGKVVTEGRGNGTRTMYMRSIIFRAYTHNKYSSEVGAIEYGNSDQHPKLMEVFDRFV